jgi:5'-methylthioadenosine phosphorylase
VLAIIGGSGLTQLANLEITRRQVVRTPYGEPSGALTFGRMRGRDIVFLARHGYGHTLAPHEVNYRANIWALHAQGVQEVIAVNAVGGITPRAPTAPASSAKESSTGGALAALGGPGAIVLPDQIIDYTYGRKHTFFEGAEAPVVHVDFTQPFCAALRGALLGSARRAGVAVQQHGVYAAVQGPRLETAAEIDRLERDGATIVGMTGMPEAALAREMELGYAMIAVVANHAAGRGNSAESISVAEIGRVLESAMQNVRTIVEQLVSGDGS